jgi:hypothetical protein
MAGHAFFDDLQFFRRGGQPVRLLPHADLEAMFDLPKEFVSAGEFLKVASANVVFVVQFLQSKECSA